MRNKKLPRGRKVKKVPKKQKNYTLGYLFRAWLNSKSKSSKYRRRSRYSNYDWDYERIKNKRYWTDEQNSKPKANKSNTKAADLENITASSVSEAYNNSSADLDHHEEEKDAAHQPDHVAEEGSSENEWKGWSGWRGLGDEDGSSWKDSEENGNDQARNSEAESDEIEDDQIESDEPESDEFGSDEFGSDEFGSDEFGSDEFWSDEQWSDEPESDEPESDEPESDEFESDGPESDPESD
ncbi:unnamed protein product [Moneuplotes crassus]|uniref:Uncharacterized protein n=1 Tax=Euplotes crassus TaxID=5936 RepID=A0AAD1XSL7_EUPCR|nr:unnamed protein product [Moneuplotes crassus]